MKTATGNLEDDHVHILRLIEVMERMVGSNNPDTSHLLKVVGIIRNFADGIHHAKEEELFFPFLSGKGFSLSAGPIAVMLNEHVSGRNYVKAMTENIELFMQGDNDALVKIYMNMHGYADLLRAHIGKENNVLFRMADRALSPSDNEVLLAEFEETEKSHSDRSEYIKDIDLLSDIYGI
jgi:hemerythrin-like domain-containing protein